MKKTFTICLTIINLFPFQASSWSTKECPYYPATYFNIIAKGQAFCNNKSYTNDYKENVYFYRSKRFAWDLIGKTKISNNGSFYIHSRYYTNCRGFSTDVHFYIYNNCNERKSYRWSEWIMNKRAWYTFDWKPTKIRDFGIIELSKNQ